MKQKPTTKVKKVKTPIVPVVKVNKVSRTEANRLRRIEKDKREKDEAQRRKIEKSIEDKQLLEALVARGHTMVRLPDRHARQAVRDWQERKTLRNMRALGYDC